MECVLVKTSQINTKPRTAQMISERSGRPGSPPPPPPPLKRARLRRSSSSSAETLAPPSVARRPRRDGSPHGPLLAPSSPDGGSPPLSPLPEPQGPLVSVNRPRIRPPHPEMLVIGREYRGTAREKQWQAPSCFLCAIHGPSRRPPDRPDA